MRGGPDFKSFRVASEFAPRNRASLIKKQPGRPVGVIAVKQKGTDPEGFNPLSLTFTVDKTRKDYNQVIEQDKPGSFGRYEKSLLESCFKGWGVNV